jgi:glycosyltransferase involved in cell wall biosynthesis
MIVKDEAAIIERCLAAAAPWIDAYAIHDTGSSDGTPDIVQSFFERSAIPGRVTHGHFDDFAQARNDSLAEARDTATTYDADYLLLCDADMELVVDDPGFRTGLDAEAYLVDQLALGLRYANLRLLRRDVPARYRGVTHEHLDLGDAPRRALTGAWFRDHVSGSSRAVKFERDLALLRDGLVAEPDNSRYVFYLAQTLRDLGRLDEAIDAYLRRAALGGWEEEVWYSLHQAALLRERRGDDADTVLRAYLTAYERRPTRAETLVELARHLREHGPRHALAHVFATRAVELPPTDDLLFVLPDCYGWRARDELSISSYWVGRYAESAALAESVLADPALPETERPRVERNLAFARTGGA